MTPIATAMPALPRSIPRRPEAPGAAPRSVVVVTVRG